MLLHMSKCRGLVLGLYLLSQQSFGASFVVNSSVDAVDVQPGDGVCASISGSCTLRAGVMELNALPGVGALQVPAGSYVFSLVGAEDQSLSGDLDIRSELVMVGVGPQATVIDAQQLDGVLHIHPGARLSLRGIGLRNGRILSNQFNAATDQSAGIHVASGAGVELDDVQITNMTSGGAVGAAITAFGDVSARRLRVSGIHPGILSLWAGLYFSGANSVTLSELEVSQSQSNFVIYATHGVRFKLQQALLLGLADRPQNLVGADFNTEALVENSTLSGSRGAPFPAVSGTVGLLDDGQAITRVRHVSFVRLDKAIIDANIGRVSIENSVIADTRDRASGCFLIRSRGGNLLAVNPCDAFTLAQGDQLIADTALPPLSDADGFTRIVALPSSWLDQALTANCLAVDQRGAVRPEDGDNDGISGCDAGAYEHRFEASFQNGFESQLKR